VYGEPLTLRRLGGRLCDGWSMERAGERGAREDRSGADGQPKAAWRAVCWQVAIPQCTQRPMSWSGVTACGCARPVRRNSPPLEGILVFYDMRHTPCKRALAMTAPTARAERLQERTGRGDPPPGGNRSSRGRGRARDLRPARRRGGPGPRSRRVRHGGAPQRLPPSGRWRRPGT
jgi:hypothetical protein